MLPACSTSSERTMNTQLRFQRRELKYYLPQELYSELIRLIRPYMTLDEHLKQSEAKSYLVRSLYLDTNDLKLYREKLDGSPQRKKFRIRGYNDNHAEIFLEVKQKYNDIVIKERALVDSEELPKILDRYGGYHPNGKRSNAEIKVINSFLFFVPILQLRPTVLIAYEREAYTGIFDDSARLTLDRNLRCLPGRFANDLFYKGTDWRFVNSRCILELKFNGSLPFFFKRIIQQLNLWAEAISKYCLCIEKCGEIY
jgi:SPX domain protein involved in polyphosphate accumulation